MTRASGQEISQFEYVRIRGNVPQEARRDPNTVAESRELIKDPRARVFVLFLDTRHVGPAASRTISRPLIDMLDDLIGIDDLIGVMTPEMTGDDVTFARKTTALQRMLAQEWWGERGRIVTTDPVEEQYRICYPRGLSARAGRGADRASAREDDARCAGRPRPLPACSARGAKGDPCHYRRVASLSAERGAVERRCQQ